MCVRQAAVLRDADGQLRGHLSDGTERESLVACGEKVASCRIFMGSYRAVCAPGCVYVCVQCQPPPHKALSEARRLDVTLLPQLW